MHILFKLQDDSYRKALERAIYFLNYNDIKFYFWDKNKDYTTIGHQHIVLLEDCPGVEEVDGFPYRHKIYSSVTEIATAPALHKELTLSELVLLIKQFYQSDTRREHMRTELNLITGNHGGVGKSTFARLASKCSGKNCLVVELFDPQGSIGKPLTEIVWQWHAKRYQETQSPPTASDVSLEDIGIEGFSSLEELKDIDAEWVCSALRDYGAGRGITRLWLVLPTFLLSSSRELVQQVDVHWHLVDLTRADAKMTLAYWQNCQLVNQASKIIFTETRPGRQTDGDLDIPYDPYLSQSRISQCIEILLRREGVLSY